LDYHIAVVACAFFLNGDPELDGSRSIQAHWLKLLQFVAVRPTLLPGFKRWARARRRPNLDTWQNMPRGYVGDRTHDNTIELLVAGDVLQRSGDTLVGSSRLNALTAVYEQVKERDLLATERAVLAELGAIPVNKTLLKGK
jgi:hypothetical protein